MDNKLYSDILNADIKNKMTFVIENAGSLSDIQLENLLKSMAFPQVLATYKLVRNMRDDKYREIGNKIEDVCLRLFEEDSINIINKYAAELEYEDFFLDKMSEICKDISTIVEAVKNGIDVNIMNEYVQVSDFDKRALESLNEEDRKLIIDNFYAFIPRELLKEYDLDKAKEADDKSLELMSSATLHGWQLEDMIEILSHNKKVEALKLYSNILYDDEMARIISNMSEDEKISALVGLKDVLETPLMVNIIKCMSDSNKLAALDVCKPILMSTHIAEIIMKMNDSIKIKAIDKCLSKLDSFFLAKILSGIPNVQNGELIGKYKEYLSGYHMAGLIAAIPEDNKKIELIDEHKSRLDSCDMLTIIRNMSYDNQIDAVKKYKDNIESDQLLELIERAIGEDNQMWLLEACADRLKPRDLVDAIETLDMEIELCALEVYQDRLDGYDISEIIRDIYGNKLKVEAIEKCRERLSSNNIASIMPSLKESPESREKVIRDNNLDEETRKIIEIILNSEEFIKSVDISSKKEFNLPCSPMTVGIEIECEGDFSGMLCEFESLYDWRTQKDGSLEHGVEIVSPVLHLPLDDSKSIYAITEYLRSIGQDVSERCGGHIHIGADYLTSIQAYVNLMEIWCNTEKVLYAICNEKGTEPRACIAKHARPIAGNIQRALEEGTIDLENEEELDRFVEELKYAQRNDRYFGVNFLNIYSIEKNTIEFRIANGTLNPDLWIDNINLFGGIVAVSEELACIQSKEQLTKGETQKLKGFEELKTDIDDKKKLQILLDLLKLEPSNYIERYESNMQLMLNNGEMIDMLFSTRAKVTKFSRGDIASVVHGVSVEQQREVIEDLIGRCEELTKEDNHLTR